jgi:hypothetical protein
MSRKLLTAALVTFVVLSFYQTGFSQLRGLRVQVGGYGGGVRVNGYSYNTNRYSPYGGFNNYQSNYGNAYSNRYSPGYNAYNSGYSSRYGYNGYTNPYQSGYRYYSQPGSYYMGNGYGNGFTFQSYPATSYRYGTPRYYNPPLRRSTSRRFR